MSEATSIGATGAQTAQSLEAAVNAATTPKRSRTSVRTAEATAASPRQTKRDRLIAMLRRKSGADVPTISAAMGWLPHSTRAALSGLRKAGYLLEATKPAKGGAARYRIVDGPAKVGSAKAAS